MISEPFFLKNKKPFFLYYIIYKIFFLDLLNQAKKTLSKIIFLKKIFICILIKLYQNKNFVLKFLNLIVIEVDKKYIYIF